MHLGEVSGMAAAQAIAWPPSHGPGEENKLPSLRLWKKGKSTPAGRTLPPAPPKFLIPGFKLAAKASEPNPSALPSGNGLQSWIYRKLQWFQAFRPPLKASVHPKVQDPWALLQENELWRPIYRALRAKASCFRAEARFNIWPAE